MVVDVGPVGADTRPGAGWQATLVVRDDFSPADVDVASRADLLVLQPLRPDEATLVGAALGLGDAAQWLTRIRQDMVGVVNRRAVRWARTVPDPDRGPADRPAGPRLTRRHRMIIDRARLPATTATNRQDRGVSRHPAGAGMAPSGAMGIIIRLVITAVSLWIATLVIAGIRARRPTRSAARSARCWPSR